MTGRLARRDTRIGDMELPAGTKVMLALAAANRDPRRWESPAALILDRSRIKEHLAFGRGAHTCVGAPLARVEVRVILEKLLEHTADIDMDAGKHGPRGARTLHFEPSFIIRGLNELHLELTPAAGFAGAQADKGACRPVPINRKRPACLFDGNHKHWRPAFQPGGKGGTRQTPSWP